VFSENEKLLKDPVDGVFQQEGVLEVSVFNLKGELLKKQERPGIRSHEKSIREDGKSRNRIFEELKQSISPFYLEENDKFEFWSSVISGLSYSGEEALFLGEDPLLRKDNIIGFVRITIDKETLNRRLNGLLLRNILIGITFLLVGFGVTYLVVRGVTKPLKKLTEGVKALGMGGKVEKVSVGTEDEMGRLAKAFNSMSESLKKREEALRESEESYRYLIENANDIIYKTDSTGHLTFFNPITVKTSGYSQQDLLGKHYLELLRLDYRKDAERFYGLQYVKKVPSTYYEFPMVTKDGKEVWLGQHVQLMMDSDRIVGFHAVARDITDRKQAEEALQESEKRLRFLSSELLKAQEKERTRLSKELHDELGQALALLKHRLRSIQRKLQEGQASLREECKSTSQYIDQTIKNVRRLSRDLSPSILEDLGLSAALRWLAENFASQHSIQTSFDIENIDHLFSQEAQTNLYRVSQEALTNIGKHAGANHVSFAVKKNEGYVSFIVEDDGKGFDANQVKARHSPEKGLGLAAMEERAHMLGAFLDIRSQVGEGTRITLTIPTEKEGME